MKSHSDTNRLDDHMGREHVFICFELYKLKLNLKPKHHREKLNKRNYRKLEYRHFDKMTLFVINVIVMSFGLLDCDVICRFEQFFLIIINLYEKQNKRVTTLNSKKLIVETNICLLKIWNIKS